MLAKGGGGGMVGWGGGVSIAGIRTQVKCYTIYMTVFEYLFIFS